MVPYLGEVAVGAYYFRLSLGPSPGNGGLGLDYGGGHFKALHPFNQLIGLRRVKLHGGVVGLYYHHIGAKAFKLFYHRPPGSFADAHEAYHRCNPYCHSQHCQGGAQPFGQYAVGRHLGGEPAP